MVMIMKENLHLNIKTYINYLFLIVLMISISSCEDKDEFTPDPISGDINDFYADVEGSYEWSSFMASSDHIFITDQRTSVHIPANSLIYEDGSDVVGEVTVGLQDYLNIGELIAHRLPAVVSPNNVKSSEGTVYVTFQQEEQILSVKPGSLVTIRISDANATPNAVLFDGWDSIFNDDWKLSEQTMSLESWSFSWEGSEWEGSGYELYITDAGWYSVGVELSPSLSYQSPICASLPVELYDESNTDVFLVLDQYDAVIPLEMNSEKMLFCATLSNVPQGSEATIVSISSLGDGNYHYGTSNAIISIDQGDILVFPKSQTKEQILDLLGMF